MVKNVKKTILEIAVAGAITYSAVFGTLNLLVNSNRSDEFGNTVVRANTDLSSVYFRSADYGPGAMERVTHYGSLTDTKKMIDGANFGKRDGLVDMLCLGGDLFENYDFVLTRTKDYDQYKDEFDDADKFLAKQKERFAKYLK